MDGWVSWSWLPKASCETSESLSWPDPFRTFPRVAAVFRAHCWYQHNLVSYTCDLSCCCCTVRLQLGRALAKYLPLEPPPVPPLLCYPCSTSCSPTLPTRHWMPKQTSHMEPPAHSHGRIADAPAWKTKWVACWLSHLYTLLHKQTTQPATPTRRMGHPGWHRGWGRVAGCQRVPHMLRAFWL